ncbi:DUF4861 family protein [Pedobacter sp. P351]|uniref:DUF4861 family protein n=1 Tax=Pedobacter superstes TaxID=3133441 RepID=UPI0030AF99C0
MKRISVRFKFTFMLLSAVMGLASCTSRKTLILQNPHSSQRDDELITLNRAILEDKFGFIPADKFLSAGVNVVQHIDTNKDGKWDEAYLLLSFAGKEEIKLPVSIGKIGSSPSGARVHVRHRRKNADDTFGPLLTNDSIPAGQLGTDFTKTPLPPFLTEGPAWENDKVGFRLYFDIRNGKDIWGKTTAKMMMDNVGINPKINYHEQAVWGMDILKVGASLGAGSLALSLPYKGRDTLIRLGGLNMGKVIFDVVADGPLLGILKLTYPEWKVLPGVAPLKLTEEIKIWAGKYFYESNVTIENAPNGAKLVTGIVKLKSAASHILNIEDANVLYTYDKQSENNDELGMAIMVPKKNFNSAGLSSGKAGDIQDTYMMTLNMLNNSTFRFYAGWSESDSSFTTESNFKKFLINESKKYSSPIIIKWRHKI